MMLKLFCRFSKLRNGIFCKYEMKNCNFLQIFKNVEKPHKKQYLYEQGIQLILKNCTPYTRTKSKNGKQN